MKKYAISDRVAVFTKPYRSNSKLTKVRFLFQDSRIMHDYLLSPELVSVIGLVDGSLSLVDIANKSGVLIESIKSLISVLKKQKIVQRIEFCDRINQSRYIRQLNFFGSFETGKASRHQMQERLSASTVAIIGLGGIGSWIAEQLVRSGITKIHLIDPDVVEESNISRQAMYNTASTGLPKVITAKDFLEGINPHCCIVTHQSSIGLVQELKIIQDVDLIVNAADFPDTDTTNLLVTSFAVPLRIPHILCGGYDGHLSFIGSTVIPGKTPCWNCYVLSGAHEKRVGAYEQLVFRKVEIEGGTLLPIALQTASIHALEAIKVITGFAKPCFTGKMAEYNFLTMKTQYRSFKMHPHCSLCKSTRNGK